MSFHNLFGMKTEELFENNEKGKGGFYPVGVNNLWHGGIHLSSPNPLRAIADGEIIAYRVNKEYLSDHPLPPKVKAADYEALDGEAKNFLKDYYEESPNKKYYILIKAKKSEAQSKKSEINQALNSAFSTGFVLIRHKFAPAQNNETIFYSLYMHLMPLAECEKKELALPAFYSANSYTVDKKQDGAGLFLYSAVDTSSGTFTKMDGSSVNMDVGQKIGVVPRNSTVIRLRDEEDKIFKDSFSHWAKALNDDTALLDSTNYHYVYSEALGKYGFINSFIGSLADQAAYKVVDSSDSDEALKGINAYSGNGTDVMQVILKDSRVNFYDEAVEHEFTGSNNPSGRFKLKSWTAKHEGKEATIFAPIGSTVTFDAANSVIKKEEHDAVNANLDKVHVLDKPYAVRAGDLIGYPGRFYEQKDLVHYEIFTENDSFMDAGWNSHFTKLGADSKVDNICDIKTFIDEVESRSANGKDDDFISEDELKAAIADQAFAPTLRKKVCSHPTEWSSATNDDTKKSLKKLFGLKKDEIDEIIKHMENFQWWEDVSGLPDSKSVCYFHPVELTDYLQKKSARGQLTLSLEYGSGMHYGNENYSLLALTKNEVKSGTVRYSLKTILEGTLGNSGSATLDKPNPGDYYLSFPQLEGFDRLAIFEDKLYYQYVVKRGDSPKGICQKFCYADSDWGTIHNDGANSTFKSNSPSTSEIDSACIGTLLYIPAHKVDLTQDTLTLTRPLEVWLTSERIIDNKRASLGAALAVNNNFDNGNFYDSTAHAGLLDPSVVGKREREPILDFEYLGATANEQDLVKITIKLPEDRALPGSTTVELKAISGDNKIRLWPRKTKGAASDIIPLPATIAVAALPMDYYVEGLNSTGKVELEVSHAGMNQTDKLVLNVVELWEKQGGQRKLFYNYNSDIDFEVKGVATGYEYAWDFDGDGTFTFDPSINSATTSCKYVPAGSGGLQAVELAGSNANKRKVYPVKVWITGGLELLVKGTTFENGATRHGIRVALDRDYGTALPAQSTAGIQGAYVWSDNSPVRFDTVTAGGSIESQLVSAYGIATPVSGANRIQYSSSAGANAVTLTSGTLAAKRIYNVVVGNSFWNHSMAKEDLTGSVNHEIMHLQQFAAVRDDANSIWRRLEVHYGATSAYLPFIEAPAHLSELTDTNVGWRHASHAPQIDIKNFSRYFTRAVNLLIAIPNIPANANLIRDLTSLTRGWYDDIPFLELKMPTTWGYDYSVRAPS